jgi:hypothetical protein
MYDMQEWEERTRSRIRAHLERCVPPLIRRFKRAGGPRDEDYTRVRSYARYLGEHGDDILFPGARKGNDTEAMDKLVEGVAVLAFCPGGVRIFGLEYDATKIETEGRDELHQLIEDFDRMLQQTPRSCYGNAT